jgi:enoyl-CoA hydratase
MSESHSERIRTEIRDHTLLITIDRPEARNAFDGAMARRMEMALDRFDEDDDLWVAIIRGEGTSFSAGQDLIAARKGDMAIAPRRGGFGVMGVPPAKPLIAAIDGTAYAGGMELVLSCDLIVATTASKFGLMEVKRGLLAVGGGCFRLPRRLPYHVAMEMVLTGEPRSAEEMHRLGLVNRLAAPGQALDTALELADQLGRNSPIAVRAAKEIVARSYAEQWTDADGWKLQMGPFERVQGSEDLREGLAAFAEKREPVWKGR